MEHVPSGVFGVLHRGGSMGFIDTIVMFAIVGTVFYGGLWCLIKVGELFRKTRAALARRDSAGH